MYLSTFLKKTLTHIHVIIFIIQTFINVFVLISQNCNYVQAHCNDRNNPFHFACHT